MTSIIKCCPRHLFIKGFQFCSRFFENSAQISISILYFSDGHNVQKELKGFRMQKKLSSIHKSKCSKFMRHSSTERHPVFLDRVIEENARSIYRRLRAYIFFAIITFRKDASRGIYRNVIFYIIAYRKFKTTRGTRAVPGIFIATNFYMTHISPR